MRIAVLGVAVFLLAGCSSPPPPVVPTMSPAATTGAKPAPEETCEAKTAEVDELAANLAQQQRFVRGMRAAESEAKADPATYDSFRYKLRHEEDRIENMQADLDTARGVRDRLCA